MKKITYIFLAVLFLLSFASCSDDKGITITFDLNYSDSAPFDKIDDKNVTYNKPYGELPTPSRPGYTFIGWYDGKRGNAEQILPDTVVQNEMPHSLYAKWEGDTINVTFDFNGGNMNGNETIEDCTVTVGNLYGKAIPNDIPQKEEYGFDYWYTIVGNSEVEIYSSTLVRSISDHTIYAKWFEYINSLTFEDEEEMEYVYDSLNVGLIIERVEWGEEGNHAVKLDSSEMAKYPTWKDTWYGSIIFDFRAKEGDTISFDVQSESGSWEPLIPLTTSGGVHIGGLPDGYTVTEETSTITFVLDKDIDYMRLQLETVDKPDWVLYIDNITITPAAD